MQWVGRPGLFCLPLPCEHAVTLVNVLNANDGRRNVDTRVEVDSNPELKRLNFVRWLLMLMGPMQPVLRHHAGA